MNFILPTNGSEKLPKTPVVSSVTSAIQFESTGSPFFPEEIITRYMDADKEAGVVYAQPDEGLYAQQEGLYADYETGDREQLSVQVDGATLRLPSNRLRYYNEFLKPRVAMA